MQVKLSLVTVIASFLALSVATEPPRANEAELNDPRKTHQLHINVN